MAVFRMAGGASLSGREKNIRVLIGFLEVILHHVMILDLVHGTIEMPGPGLNV